MALKMLTLPCQTPLDFMLRGVTADHEPVGLALIEGYHVETLVMESLSCTCVLPFDWLMTSRDLHLASGFRPPSQLRSTDYGMCQSRGRLYILLFRTDVVSYGQIQGFLHILKEVLPGQIRRDSSIEEIGDFTEMASAEGFCSPLKFPPASEDTWTGEALDFLSKDDSINSSTGLYK